MEAAEEKASTIYSHSDEGSRRDTTAMQVVAAEKTATAIQVEATEETTAAIQMGAVEVTTAAI